MEGMLALRQSLIHFYKRYETPVAYGMKWFIGFIVFILLTQVNPNSPFSNIFYTFLCSLLTAILPAGGIYMLIIFTVTVHLYFVSVELSILALVFMLLVYIFYIRIFPKESLLAVAMVFAFYFKIPFIVPLFAGMYVGLSGVVPVIIGTMVWYSVPLVYQLSSISPTETFSLFSMPDAMIQMYTTILDYFLPNTNWIMAALIFSLAVILAHIIRSLSFMYAEQMAILAGGILIFLGFLITMLMGATDIGFIQLFLGSVISVCLMLGVQFMDIVLDYQKTETVRFQDNDNFYHVKIIPKVQMKSTEEGNN